MSPLCLSSWSDPGCGFGQAERKETGNVKGAELLGSPRMKEVLAELKGRYADRYVILDVPPVLTGADALTFAPLVDAIVVVVQSGRTSAEDLRKALDQMPREKVLGVVMNRQKASPKRYGYPYGGYPSGR